MNRPLLLSVLCGCVALAACTTIRPVAGQMERSDETFTGSVSGSGYREGSGDFTIVSSRHATCRGALVYTSRRKAEGVLSCDDGRTGSFHIASVGASGTGYGELAGQRFTFNIGGS